MTIAHVNLWGTTVGVVELDGASPVARFQFTPEFRRAGIEISPLYMPVREAPYAFPALPRESFHGLPGMLADALPDRFGTALIDAWLAGHGRPPGSFDAVERLCYTGRRGMGALEFAPATGPRPSTNHRVQVDALVALASEVLSDRDELVTSLRRGRRERAMREILRVGTSAGGARAKAVVAWNPTTNDVRSGQLDAGEGFEHWLIKFDGVAANRDRELADPLGSTVVEYAYWLMARDAGIEISEARLFEEGGRRHFMTRRFDRRGDEKLHMQSLAALAHLDVNQPAAHSYEQAFATIRTLGLGMDAVLEQYRRMVFNVLAGNRDDHVKNIAFLMDRSGQWTLSPAYDITYAYHPAGRWTGQHQLSIDGARTDVTAEDVAGAAATAMLSRSRARAIVDEVADVVRAWPRYAERAGVDARRTEQIGAVLTKTLRTAGTT